LPSRNRRHASKLPSNFETADARIANAGMAGAKIADAQMKQRWIADDV
jgi:hypothetical protein